MFAPRCQTAFMATARSPLRLRWPACAAALALAESHRRQASRCEAASTQKGCPFGGAGSDATSRVVQRAAPRSKHPEPLEGSDFAVFRRPEGTAPSMASKAPRASEMKMTQLLESLCSGGDAVAPRLILLGEVHDDSVAHRLQLHILQHCAEACRAQGRRLILSLEMFEADVQDVLDEYVLQRAIREQDMLQDARPWGNYQRDYRPLVEFCRERGIRVVAANAPRRYVSLVAREGAKSLQGVLAKACLPLELPPMPLPPPSPAYCQKFAETIAMQMPASAGNGESGSCPFIGFRSEDVRQARPEMLEAQQLWDHTMAKSVAAALDSESSGQDDSSKMPNLVIHVCGAFHCAHGLGIPEALPTYWADPHASKSAKSEKPWLPIDEASVGSSTVDLELQDIGPKASPPGVVSVVCWPASVQPTLELVRSGKAPRALAPMGDWVVITEETWQTAAERDK
eukprot:TRINITY_DN61144_c0_g1_i1.p1 TRINITY_DN61144_c0_g1~~TRINITY_DN61144_c0_g1_i1.p1  ORF type:complete len:456 (-),score=88.29 TRINITY_DN61144_c0_g1_i1:61-1428(-)